MSRTLNNKKQITIYVDDEINQELINMMVAKARTLTFIVEELLRQAIKEKKRKRKIEKQDSQV